jgi:hypothetical protein
VDKSDYEKRKGARHDRTATPGDTESERSAPAIQERQSLDALAPHRRLMRRQKSRHPRHRLHKTLIDSDGRKNEADPDKVGYIPDDRNIFLEYVYPGVTDQGQAVFTVGPDPRGFKLAIGDADLLSNEHGIVPLGF